MNEIKEEVIDDSILNIGKVISVYGRSIKVKVEKMKNSSYFFWNGELIKNVAVGSYIKIMKGFKKIVGVVEGEIITIEQPSNFKYYRHGEKNIRVLEVKLIGYFENRKFIRGIKELPLIDNECFITLEEEINLIHSSYEKKDSTVCIGNLLNNDEINIKLNIDKIYASHIGIFGNTGSGKSYTLSKLYYELFENYYVDKKSKFILIDFNGEYSHEESIANDKEIINLSTNTFGGSKSDKIEVSFQTIQDPEFWALILEATEKTQQPFLKRMMKEYSSMNKDLKQIFLETIRIILNKKNKFHLDVIHQLARRLQYNEEVRKKLKEISYHNKNSVFYIPNRGNAGFLGDTNVVDNFMKELSEFENFKFENLFKEIEMWIIIFFYYEFVKYEGNKEHIEPLLKRLDSRIDEIEKTMKPVENVDKTVTLTILNLSKVNIKMRKILPMIICKEYYELKKKNGEYLESSLHIIIDEAHNILSEQSERESEIWKDYRLETFEEIIKEGRKFGVFLTIASQRPSDISPTIISQLHNYFIHRLINDGDIKMIERTISYLDKISFESIPFLPQGSCILAGLMLEMPMTIKIGEIPTSVKPRSDTIELSEIWKKIGN